MTRLTPLVAFAAIAAAGAAIAQPVALPLGLGTQVIYGPGWNAYNFTGQDALTEQRGVIAKMGSNQIKIRLAKGTTHRDASRLCTLLCRTYGRLCRRAAVRERAPAARRCA